MPSLHMHCIGGGKKNAFNYLQTNMGFIEMYLVLALDNSYADRNFDSAS